MSRSLVAACTRCKQLARRYNSSTTGSVLDPGPSTPKRSWILDEVLPDPSTRPKTRARQRVLEHYESVKQERSQEEVEERAKWYADPWYRLSKTPYRQCIVTRQRMPCGFMVNFRPTNINVDDLPDESGMKDPKAGSSKLILLPDRVLHERYVSRKKGFGFWATLHKDVVERLGHPGPHIGAISKIKGLKTEPDIAPLIESQLCQRVIQELELLVVKMQSSSPRAGIRQRLGEKSGAKATIWPNMPVLRYLSQAEARLLREEARYDGDGAVAFLSLGRGREEGALSEVQEGDTHDGDPGDGGAHGGEDTSSSADPIPQVASNTNGSPSSITTSTTHAVPLYDLAELLLPEHGAPAFELVEKILKVEKIDAHRAHMSAQAGSSQKQSDKMTEGPATAAASNDDRTTDGATADSGILVLSTWTTIGHSTTSRAGHIGVPLAIALWRLRLWHGGEWAEMDVDQRGRRV